MEHWKQIVGYEGLYEVSDLGNVRSWIKPNRSKRTEPIVLKKVRMSTGYDCVTLCGKLKHIHRLVAEAFLSNPNGYRIINHKDENKQNNEVTNLEWCTQKHNINWGTSLMKRAMTQRYSQSRCKRIAMVDKNSNVTREYISIKEAERSTGIKRRTIQRLLSSGVEKNGISFIYINT